jgi:hypothetical protein
MQPHELSRHLEQFHLLFLAQLGEKVDKKGYALKGGCNLRFFLKSVRYSEDMDLDAGGIDTHVLRDRVRSIPRDLFDLHHLIASGASLGTGAGLERHVLDKARANATIVGFETFKSQVLAYLSPEDQARYDSASVWDTLVLEVAEALEDRL